MNIKKSVNHCKNSFQRYNTLHNYKITFAQLLRYIPVEHRKSYILYTLASTRSKNVRKINIKVSIDEQFLFVNTIEGKIFWRNIYLEAVKNYLKSKNINVKETD